MAITIQTSEFTGLIGDVAPFACPHDDLPDLNVVRLEWDGEMLHATATDTLRIVRSSWHPDDDEGDDSKGALFAAYGGVDDRWVMHIRLDEAVELAKHFKLPAKEGAVPLTLSHDRGQLTVSRSADTGRQDIKVIVTTRMAEFPDVRNALDVAPRTEHVTELAFVGRHLADFGVVRQRGVMRLAFCGPERATRVTIGKRFVGTIRPDRSGQPRQEALIGAGSVDF